MYINMYIYQMDKTGCVTTGNGKCVTPNNNVNTKLHLAIVFEQGATSPQFVENLANAASAATGTPEALIPVYLHVHMYIYVIYVYIYK